jgi:peptidoglycan/xylan/chitin deacetylase (PgdA/CDA1 family)
MTQKLIINFHGLGDPHSGVESSERPFWIKRSAFSGILDRIVAVNLTNSAIGHNIPEMQITFDDGNLSDLTAAFPELARRQLKATFFVCVGRMKDPRYLNRKQMQELIAGGMKIGNHGMFQRNLRMLSPPELKVEVNDSRQMLEDILGMPVTEFAIPYGAYNRRVMKWLRNSDLTSIYTSDRGLANAEDLVKPRESIMEGMLNQSIPEVMLKPKGVKTIIRRKLAATIKSWR